MGTQEIFSFFLLRLASPPCLFPAVEDRLYLSVGRSVSLSVHQSARLIAALHTTASESLLLSIDQSTEENRPAPISPHSFISQTRLS